MCFNILLASLNYCCNLMDATVFPNETKNSETKLEKDLVMACHIPPLKETKKQRGMPSPILCPVLFNKCTL